MILNGDATHTVKGYTIEIDADELEEVDEFEDVDSKMYRRVMVETQKGYFAWTYEYLLPIPRDLKPISKWTKD